MCLQKGIFLKWYKLQSELKYKQENSQEHYTCITPPPKWVKKGKTTEATTKLTLAVSNKFKTNNTNNGAPLMSKFGNLSIQEILVVTSAYVCPSTQTLWGGEFQDNLMGGGWRMSTFLGRKSCGSVLLGNQRFSWQEIA